jgi:hypothetical protein
MNQENQIQILDQFNENLSQKTYQSNIHLEISEKFTLNAEADWKTGVVKIGKELIENFAQDELEVVLAHEYGHIALRPFNNYDFIPTKWQFAKLSLLTALAILSYHFQLVPDWVWLIAFLLVLNMGLIRFGKEDKREELRADLLASILLKSPSRIRDFLESYFAKIEQRLSKKKQIWRLMNFWRIIAAKKELRRRIEYLEQLIKNVSNDSL